MAFAVSISSAANGVTDIFQLVIEVSKGELTCSWNFMCLVCRETRILRKFNTLNTPVREPLNRHKTASLHCICVFAFQSQSASPHVIAKIMQAAIEQLEIAENEILKSLEIAAKTCNNLQRTPCCDHDQLSKDSADYAKSLFNAHDLISAYVFYLAKPLPSKENIEYQSEIAKLERRVSHLQNEIHESQSSAELARVC